MLKLLLVVGDCWVMVDCMFIDVVDLDGDGCFESVVVCVEVMVVGFEMLMVGGSSIVGVVCV